MLMTQEVAGVLSFNVEPSPIAERHDFSIGDNARLRDDLKGSDSELIEKIGEKIGHGPFLILKLGTRKHLLKNVRGQKSWVPWPFLVSCKKNPVAAPG